MFLALGTSTPANAAKVLHTAIQCGLKEKIEINESYPHFSVTGRYPVLQHGDVYAFGTEPVCNYIRSLSSITPEDLVDVVLADGRSPSDVLSCALRDAVIRAFPHFSLSNYTLPIEVRFNELSGNKKSSNNGDYSFSGCTQLSQVLKPLSPNQIAQEIAHVLNLDSELQWILDSVVVVGFYINFTLAPHFLSSRIDLYRGAKLPPSPLLKRQRVVVDFSSPNIAKEMHVGHLRSTIIGDSLSRMLEFVGHQVLTVNHVGDWGTQFGMLLQYLFDKVNADETLLLQKLDEMSLTQLTLLYKQSKKEFDANEEFKSKARNMVVELQHAKEDSKVKRIWNKLVTVSKRGFDLIYSRLKVSFDDRPDRMKGTGYCGESFYQPLIESAIASVQKHTVLRGQALLLFTGLPEAQSPPTEENPDGEIPLFLRKSDGGFGYDSTDLAAVKFRCEELKADRIIYVTDAGQSLHFNMIFQAAKLCKWKGAVQLDHCKFGVVTAKGGTKFKTRDGDTVTLSSLLDAAKQTMKEILLNRQEENAFTAEEVENLSEVIGMAAIKYFDLRNNRTKDYGFDLELMCSPLGDTGVYLLYCYARVCSILEKGEQPLLTNGDVVYDLSPTAASSRERSVSLVLSRFTEIVNLATANLTPHPICGYLYTLASEFSSFVTDDAERIWAKGEDEKRVRVLEPNRGLQRWLLCQAIKTTLFQGLGLLGIVPPQRM